MPKPKINKSKLSYFPIQKHWRKLGPLFKSKDSRTIWYPNLLEYMQQRSGENGFKYEEKSYWKLPRDFDSCDWRFGRIGRHPAYWDFVCHSACHWLADMCLHIASTAYPAVPWRIVSSHKHSTVWNGSCDNPVLFDVNFLALEVSPKEAWNLAINGKVLKPGQRLRPWVLDKK